MKKRVIAIVLMLVALSTLLVGCKKKVQCESCGKVARCSTVKILGEETYMCDDCLDEWNELFG